MQHIGLIVSLFVFKFIWFFLDYYLVIHIRYIRPPILILLYNAHSFNRLGDTWMYLVLFLLFEIRLALFYLGSLGYALFYLGSSGYSALHMYVLWRFNKVQDSTCIVVCYSSMFHWCILKANHDLLVNIGHGVLHEIQGGKPVSHQRYHWQVKLWSSCCYSRYPNRGAGGDQEDKWFVWACLKCHSHSMGNQAFFYYSKT